MRSHRRMADLAPLTATARDWIAALTSLDDAVVDVESTASCVGQLRSQVQGLGDEVAGSEQARRVVDQEAAALRERNEALEGRVRESLEELTKLRERNAVLEGELKDSMPASHVQELLQAAEQRVAQVNTLVRSSEGRVGDAATRAEAAAKRENRMRDALVDREQEVVALRREFSGITDQLERRLGRERSAREDAEGRLRLATVEKEDAETSAVRATHLAEKMEKRIISLEAETAKLREMVKTATDNMGIMDTIAKIRETELPPGAARAGRAARGGGGGAGGSFDKGRVGFDAVADRVEGVAREVKRMTRSVSGTPKAGVPVPGATKAGRSVRRGPVAEAENGVHQNRRPHHPRGTRP